MTGLGPTANPAGHCRRSYARPAHAAFPGTRRPSRKIAQCCPRPRAAIAQGESSFADLSLGAAPQREKARSPFKPTLPSLPVPGPFSPGTLGHPSGCPPENGLASEGSGVDSRERDWSEESGGLQSAAIGEGSEKGANEENRGRVGAQRSQQPVGLQLIANLGWETDSGPLGGPPPESHPLALRARGEVQDATWEAKAIGAGPDRSPPPARWAPRLPRAAAAPAAQKQSPSQGSHRRAPPAPLPAAAALPILLAPLRSTGPLPRPGKGSANQGGRGEWVPGVFSE